MTLEFPLNWPLHKPRTRMRKTARFNTGFAVARDGIIEEIRRLGGKNAVISTDIPLRRDGLPYAGKSAVDPGVAVYFELKGKSMCFACDSWVHIDDNMQAIRKTIEALRGIERWGGLGMQEEAFTGFTALPPPPSDNMPWFRVLNVEEGVSLAEAEAAFKRQAMKTHPDSGGSHDAMARLNKAIEEARIRKTTNILTNSFY